MKAKGKLIRPDVGALCPTALHRPTLLGLSTRSPDRHILSAGEVQADPVEANAVDPKARRDAGFKKLC